MSADRTSDYHYLLPPASIAQRPVPRGTSRLMVLAVGAPPVDRRIADLPLLLRPGDLMVVNDTRVLPARLQARRQREDGTLGGAVEALLVEPEDRGRWWCLLRPGRRVQPRQRLRLVHDGVPGPAVTVVERREALFLLAFESLADRASSDAVPPDVAAAGAGGAPEEAAFQALLARFGSVPLPPYIERPADERDRADYQTVFAREPGAVAAPTAGLHFEPDLLQRLRERGVDRCSVTLHVGPGTFRPVKDEDPGRHQMHAERYHVPEKTRSAIGAARERGGRVIAVGTTVVRALESACLESGSALPAAGAGRTRLFIRPGFEFQAVDCLLTNFHLPRSTLLMMVCAFAGRARVLAAYRLAVERGYRFYSYGDAMLLERERSSPAS